MANIQFDINSFNNYLSANNIKVSNSELSQLNSIFSQCDTLSENGEQKPDGKLTGDEVPSFQRMVAENLSKISNYVRGFIDSLAGVKPINTQQKAQMPEIQEVECHRTNEELKIYNQKLEEAKNVLIENAEKLGLSKQELSYIKTITTESITNGPARYDRSSDRVTFNINDQNPPHVGSFVKIIMHEITHGIKKNERYTQAQELACEQRGIEIARKLYDENMIDNFPIWGDQNGIVDIEDLNSSEKTNDYLNRWIKNYDYLPTE